MFADVVFLEVPFLTMKYALYVLPSSVTRWRYALCKAVSNRTLNRFGVLLVEVIHPLASRDRRSGSRRSWSAQFGHSGPLESTQSRQRLAWDSQVLESSKVDQLCRGITAADVWLVALYFETTHLSWACICLGLFVLQGGGSRLWLRNPYVREA